MALMDRLQALVLAVLAVLAELVAVLAVLVAVVPHPQPWLSRQWQQPPPGQAGRRTSAACSSLRRLIC
jgi:hypothetical protein